MQTIFKFPSNYKRILLITDENALAEGLPLVDILDKNNIESIIYVITDKHQEEIKNDFPHLPLNRINFLTSSEHEKLQAILNQQIIGTKIFISGPWSLIQSVQETAYKAGFTEDEIQFETVGSKEEKVFCVSCYSISKMQESDIVKCEHCEKELEVATNFFSKVHDAYIGYIKIG